MSRSDGGIELQEAHFPGCAPIEAYGNGGFRFAKISHRGSIMCLPSGIYEWNAATFDSVDESTFARAFKESKEIEVLLIGTGAELVRIPAKLQEKFRDHGILADSMATGAAVRTFNVLIAENRAVSTYLLAVD